MKPSRHVLERGDIVLVPFPFTDLTSQKVRPAIVLTPNPGASDVLVAFISSAVESRPAPTDYVLRDDHADFSVTGLKKPSIFKMNKLLTLQRNLIIRRLGRVSPRIQKELDIRLKSATGLLK